MSDETKPGVGQACETDDSLCDNLQCDHVSVIRGQQLEIDDLKQALDTIVIERDLLLCEVSKLKFEIQVLDLKRMYDDHGVCGTHMAEVLMGGRDMQCHQSGCHSPNGWTQGGLHKKGSVRDNGDVLKRSRVQTANYELSQDLLDKQIEMLERKYGGAKARDAALTIQRAFRRYTLLKKFATITAMAKAEKRLSRRIQTLPEVPQERYGGEKEAPKFHHGVVYEARNTRPMPLRSMSMREARNNVDVMPLVRSQSGRCDIDNYHYCDTINHYYVPEEAFSESSQFGHDNTLSRESVVRRTIAGGCYPQRPRSQVSHKIPPEVPKRTSSISCRSTETGRRSSRLNKTRDNGSLSSVQSSGSDSSLSTDRVTCESSEDNHRGSPIWKRKTQSSSPEHRTEPAPDCQELSRSHTSAAYQLPHQDHATQQHHTIYKVSETVRKRQYRVGLNLFNKKPEKGVAYLIRRGFLENSPSGVARFLISRKGLSKQMIGEYLGNLQNSFNMAVLDCFSHELDFSEMQVDVALRKFQTYFRMPGEAQKIERLMEVFGQRYCQCDRDLVASLRSPDTVFVLAFAIIMLNTDLHTPNIKPERRMKIDDFVKNLRGIDDGSDIDRDLLVGIYERVKVNEFKPGSDHVTQVMKVQSTIVGKKPNMALPHRRLVCYCRLYEIPDIYKKERPGVHQREVFLFNDLLVITKILSKKKSSVTYTFRQSFALCGMLVTLFEVPHYQYGIRLCQRVDNKVLVTFNARNEHDRCKFAEDLRESISEMDEMENLRIDAELERQKSSRGGRTCADNRDSGVADVEVCPCIQGGGGDPVRDLTPLQPEPLLKRSALSNSLLDIHEQFAGEKPQQRRGSMGSLDSGMSISFQSMSTSTVSHESSPQNGAKHGTKAIVHQQSFLGGLFAKRERKSSRVEESSSTEV